jgi:hypothetical protein
MVEHKICKSQDEVVMRTGDDFIFTFLVLDRS